jgi:predicted nuclease of restriction endonuclease-like (RecB) superfamily
MGAVQRKKKSKAGSSITKTKVADLEPSFEGTYTRIRNVLLEARHRALRAVNNEMARAYWETGREIVEEEQRGRARATYGSRVVQTLSECLTAELGKGYTLTNLKYMRQFYLAFPIGHALRDQLTWTPYRLLLSVKNEQARGVYLNEAAKANWSTRELDRQIHSLLFERLAKSRNKEGVLRLVNEGAEAFSPQDLLRDPFVLEFTGLPERGEWLETDLEQALMNKLQQFLLELGRDFFFVARQKRITVDNEHGFVDLVFYHRTLRCFVLIDLKVGKLTHADVGRMLAYVGYYKQHEMREGENPPVGLILCTDAGGTIARYALLERDEKVFASRYQLYLPSETELQTELEREREELLGQQRLMVELEDDS